MRPPPQPAVTSVGPQVAIVDRHITVPAASAARAIATSPSGWASFWKATGATSTGCFSSAPSSSIRVLTSDTSTSTRGHSSQSANASTLRRRVRSSPAPPAK